MRRGERTEEDCGAAGGCEAGMLRTKGRRAGAREALW